MGQRFILAGLGSRLWLAVGVALGMAPVGYTRPRRGVSLGELTQLLFLVFTSAPAAKLTRAHNGRMERRVQCPDF